MIDERVLYTVSNKISRMLSNGRVITAEYIDALITETQALYNQSDIINAHALSELEKRQIAKLQFEIDEKQNKKPILVKATKVKRGVTI